MREIHVNVPVDVLDAIRNYSVATGEISLSWVVRTLLRERLLELGYLKDKPGPTQS